MIDRLLCAMGFHDWGWKKHHQQLFGWMHHGHRCVRPKCKGFKAWLFAEDCEICKEADKK